LFLNIILGNQLVAMSITPNLYPTTVGEYEPRTIKLEEEIERGLAVATELANFTALIPFNSRCIEDLQAVITKQLAESETAVNAATAFVCLGEVANRCRLETEFLGHYPVGSSKNVDYKMLSAFNHALRGLVGNATDTTYESAKLFETLITFAQNHDYIQNEYDAGFLKGDVYNRIVSAWCEQNIIQLLSAVVPLEIASIEEDAYGHYDAALVLEDDAGTRVSLDFKSFLGTLKTAAEDVNLSVKHIHTISSKGVDKDNKGDRSGSPYNPVWYIFRNDKHHQIHYAVALDIGRLHIDNLPQKLAPNEFIGLGDGVVAVEEFLKYILGDIKRNPDGKPPLMGVSDRLGQITVRSGIHN
jgi:hypothetical protein